MSNQSNESNNLTLQQAQIQCAISLAQLSLFGKLDKQGKPLFDHVCRVAKKAMDRGLSHEQVIAAYLHETMEDTNLNLSSLQSLFGSHVILLIAFLSRPMSCTYEYYIRYIGTDRYATEVKLCDLEDNLDSSRGPIPNSLKARYIKAKEYLERKLKEFEKERS